MRRKINDKRTEERITNENQREFFLFGYITFILNASNLKLFPSVPITICVP